MEPITSVFAAIVRERKYQDAKYGTLEARNLSMRKYLRIARRELAEAFISLAAGNEEDARLELLQVVAVGVAALQRHGVVERTTVYREERTR